MRHKWKTKFFCVRGTWDGEILTSDDNKTYRTCGFSVHPQQGYFMLWNVCDDWYAVHRAVITSH